MVTARRARITDAPSFRDEGHGFDIFGLHPPALETATRLGAPLYERYFRVDSVGVEHIPPAGAAIVVSNHAGALPVDAAMLCLDILRNTERIPRAVADHFVPRLPLVSTYLARVGVVSGTRTNVRMLIERGELLALFPEGVSGVAKPFRDRYQLQRWSVGFAELAIRHRVPVIPTAIIGAEESWPLLGKIDRLHLFGSPYLPVPATLVPLPAHYRIRYGTPLHLDHGFISKDADDPRIVARAAERARLAVAHLIQDALDARRGVFR